ncbi:MAG: ABC transporter permease [Oscillospiraceae bacterium]|nr:ABC transporter permease [Oscillospiraceae bacterium]
MTANLFTLSFFTELLSSGLRMTTPILYTALGETFSERAGITNIGLEGLMVVGAVSSFIGVSLTGSLLIGVLIAIGCGVLINALFAYCVIYRHSDQIVMGMALNILAAGAASFLYRAVFGISQTPEKVEGFQAISIPGLSKIPVLGQVLFSQNILLYLALILVPVCSFVLFKTPFGLHLRSVGEYPKAADSMGIKVYRMRFFGCIIGGALGGLGGAYLSIAYMNMYVDNLVSGRGYIALAAVIFGKWNPKGVLMATLLFGFTDALQMRLQAMSLGIPYQFMAMLPYLVTLAALVCFVGKSVGPAANTVNYVRGGKE